jgi:hypothetical protein
MKGKNCKQMVGSEKLLYHCGYEDTVMRHMILLKDIEDLADNCDVKRNRLIEKAHFTKRLFTVQCI